MLLLNLRILSQFNNCHKQFYRTISDKKMLLKDFLNKIGEKIPLHLACDWDNVGLLVEPMENFQIERILLTNDLTEKVIDESIKKNINLIISYHPPIFRPIKKLCQSNWKERIIIKCLVNKIAIYSPHTALDAIFDGINDWLLSPFNCTDIKPIELSMEKPKFEYQIMLENNDDNCNQLNLKIDNLNVNKSSGIIQCNADQLSIIMNEFHKQNLKFSSITTCPKLPLLNHGMGRIAKLSQPLKINEIVKILKTTLNLKNIRLALSTDHPDDNTIINTIGVCAGSGSSILKQTSVDFFITGEMSHHDILDAIHSGTSLALCEHTNTERGFIQTHLYQYLRKNFQSLSIIISEFDDDPIKIV